MKTPKKPSKLAPARNLNEAQLPALDGRRFHWADGAGTAEASDLGRGWMGRLWLDAADLGLAIRSHRTGKVERFVLVSEERDRDNDVVAWAFAPLNPGCTARKILVLND